jgi:hypothetical protein
MSNLSDLLGGGSTAGTITAVASGALSNGDKVILKSDGKVEVVSGTAEAIPDGAPMGSTGNFFGGQSTYLFTQVAFDPTNSNRFAITYVGVVSGNYWLYSHIGTISGNTITLGTTTVVVSSTYSNYVGEDARLIWDTHNTNRLILTWYRNGQGFFMHQGTVSGTGITWAIRHSSGTSGYVYGSGNGINNRVSIALDPHVAGRMVLAYIHPTSNKIAFRVMDCNSTTSNWSWGSDYSSTQSYSDGAITAASMMLHFDPVTANKVICAGGQPTWKGAVAVVLTLPSSGTTISSSSIGNRIALSLVSSSNQDYEAPEFELTGSGGFLFVSRNDYLSGQFQSIVSAGTIDYSANTATYGNEAPLWTGAHVPLSNSMHLSVLPNNRTKFVIMCHANGGTGPYGQVQHIFTGSISGDTVTLDSQAGTYWSEYQGTNESIGVSTTGSRFLAFYQDTGSGSYSTSWDWGIRLGQLSETNVTVDNFIGISDAAYSNGATATIQVAGSTDDAQSGLTVGSKHYVQNDGSLSTTADNPSVVSGLALSSTNLLIKKR